MSTGSEQCKDLQAQANEYYQSRFGSEQRETIARAQNGDEKALEALQEQLLSIDKVATYHMTEEIEWQILLGADRVLVRTDTRGTVFSATYQYHQDWFTPWTVAANQDEDLMVAFAELVGYYEPDSDLA